LHPWVAVPRTAGRFGPQRFREGLRRRRNDPANRQKETPMGPVLTILVVIVVVAAVVWFLRRA